jgi:hypothetical protein
VAAVPVAAQEEVVALVPAAGPPGRLAAGERLAAEVPQAPA